jgi:hypothetical protein
MRGAAGRAAVRLADRVTGRRHLPLPPDYPLSADPAPRWGHGKPPSRHLEALIRSGTDRYRSNLEAFARYAGDLARVPGTPSGGAPGWANGWLPGMDAAAIYGFLRMREPRLYLEVGSGHSTTFARRAIEDGGLDTTIVSIDPQPRAEIDAICDEVIRSPLEVADVSAFARLTEGDVVFFDGSHRTFTNSDVVAFFLDLLPAMPAGVLVGVHDVYLPEDYPPEITERYYSEQYVLGAYLLGAGSGERIELAAHFASGEEGLAGILEPLWQAPEHAAVERHGVGFWFAAR